MLEVLIALNVSLKRKCSYKDKCKSFTMSGLNVVQNVMIIIKVFILKL